MPLYITYKLTVIDSFMAHTKPKVSPYITYNWQVLKVYDTCNYYYYYYIKPEVSLPLPLFLKSLVHVHAHTHTHTHTYTHTQS